MTKHSDFGSDLRWQHDGVFHAEETDAKKVGVLRVRNLEPTRLAEYFNRKYINSRQYDGGNALHKDWYYAGCSESLVARYDDYIAGEHGSDVRAMSELRFRRALRDLGKQLSSMAVHVCLMEGSSADWAKKMGMRENEGISVLRTTLNGLADFYQNQWTTGRG